MNALKTATALACVGTITLGAQAAVIDDFESPLSGYTTTVVLDTDAPGGANTSALEIVGGEVTFNTTVFQSIEQLAIIRDGLTLAVGEEVQLDVTRGVNADRGLRGNQDFGLYVGGFDPVAASVGDNDTRANYITAHQRDDGADMQSAIFNAAIPGGNTADFGGNASYDTMFIARTGVDTYEAGYYDGATRTIIRTETFATDAGGPVVGFYADVRGEDVLQSGYDNLTIIPEPGSLALLGLGGLALLRRRRA